MTPKLKKELIKIYDTNDMKYPSGTIDAHDFVNYILSDIENHSELKEAKFKLSFWKSKKTNDIKYTVCKGHCIRTVIKEWSDVDPGYLFSFVLFGDN